MKTYLVTLDDGENGHARVEAKSIDEAILLARICARRAFEPSEHVVVLIRVTDGEETKEAMVEL